MASNAPKLPPIDVLGPTSLRKSFSVDSFSSPTRNNSVASARGNTSTVIEVPEEYPPSAPSWHTEYSPTVANRPPLRPSRTRNSSFSTDDNSDDPLHGTIPKRHRHPIKDSTFSRADQGKDRFQTGDDFSSGPSSSSSALPRSRSTVFNEYPRNIQPAPPQNVARKMTTSRSRSGSLNVGSSNGGVAMVVNTQTASSPQWSPVNVAVVGTYGSGKSTFIRKGCKAYGMSEPSPSFPSADNGDSFKYTSRVGKIPQNASPAGTLRVIEVDLAELKLSNPNSSVWPDSAPNVDGFIVCYDATSEKSFAHVEKLIAGYESMKLPCVVIACKSDMDEGHGIDPQRAASVLEKYQAGLVEVSIYQEIGKDKMRRCFEWMIKSIYRERTDNRLDRGPNYQNAASPDVLTSPVPWDSRSSNNTPIPITTQIPRQTIPPKSSRLSQPQSIDPVPQRPRSPSVPNSPSRARSTNDLVSEHEKSKARYQDEQPLETSRSTFEDRPRGSLPAAGPSESLEDLESRKRLDQRLAPWATVDELLDKLIFSVVSDDDRTYVSNFLLTYRRFTTPRETILTMQRRMRQLDQQSSDPMFSCLAQMSICRLLADWIRDYPTDFAVRGTASALTALVKSIIGKTHLIHYGLEFLPFLEVLPNLVDQDAAWAKKFEDPLAESDDSYSMGEEEEDLIARPTDSPSASATSLSFGSSTKWGVLPSTVPASASRERKQSLPLTAKSLVMPAAKPSYSNNGSVDSADFSSKHILRELFKISQELNDIESVDVAQEITRMETRLFLDIKPRHWLKHTLVSSSIAKDPETDTVARFGHVSNHIAEWVASLILCHDKPKARAKQIEKFIEIGVRLRILNNYSALRAVVAGINSATFIGDAPMDIFRNKSPEAWKSYQSWDVLFQAVRSHRAYRMALRNTKGACIPALEVHLLDLIRAHEGNQDFNEKKVHWAKYNMIGKFIAGTMQSQDQCRTSGEYDFPERPHIRDMILKECIMDIEMQSTRNNPPSEIDDDRVSLRNVTPRQYSRDAALLKKIVFWAQ